MGDLHLGGAGGQSLSTVGDKEGVFRQDRIEDGLDGVAVGGRQDRTDGGAATIGRDQNRHEFVRKSVARLLPPRFRALRSGGSVTDWPFCARFHSCDPLRLDSTKVSSASTMPPSISPAGLAASRNRWRQRNAVLWAIPQRPAAWSIVSPSASDCPKASHWSLCLQARQQRGGQCVETLAAGFASISSQPTGHPAGIFRATRLAVRALAVHANGQFDRRSRPLARATGHNRHGVSTLRVRKIIHLADPSQKRLPVHGCNSSISARISCHPT